MKTFRQFLEASDLDSGDAYDAGGAPLDKKAKKKKKDGRMHPGEKEVDVQAGLDVNTAVSDKGRSRGSH